MTQKTIPNKGPVKEYRAGGVRASIWRNTTVSNGKRFEYESVSIERRYKQGDEWKTTNSYGLADLQKLRHVVSQAEAHLLGSDRDE